MTSPRLQVAVSIAVALAAALGAACSPGPERAPATPSAHAAALPADHPWRSEPALPRPSAGEASATEAALNRLQDQVNVLSAELKALRRQTVSGGAAAPGSLPSASRPTTGPSAQALMRQRIDPTARAKAEQAEATLAADRAAAFSREPADPHWAGSTALALRQAWSVDHSGSLAVRSLECRSQTCRVEISGDDSERLDESVSQFGARIAEHLGTMRISRGDGSSTMVLYLSR